MSVSAKPTINLPWKTREQLGEVECGDSYLVAVCVRTSSDDRPTLYWWEFAVVTVEEFGCEVDGSSWGWSWDDIEWAIPIRELKHTLPLPGPLEETPTTQDGADR